MEAELGMNWVPLFVLFPIVIIAIVVITWFVAKAHVTAWKRVILSIGGIFSIFGFVVTLFVLYYQLSPTFAGTFRFYAYTVFAPEGDPFEMQEEGYQPALMLRGVANTGGEVTLLNHPDPEFPTIVYLFTPGKFITTDLQDDVLSIPITQPGSLPRVISTSLWWALSKDIFSEVSSAQ